MAYGEKAMAYGSSAMAYGASATADGEKPWHTAHLPWHTEKKPWHTAHLPWQTEKKPWHTAHLPWHTEHLPRQMEKSRGIRLICRGIRRKSRGIRLICRGRRRKSHSIRLICRGIRSICHCRWRKAAAYGSSAVADGEKAMAYGSSAMAYGASATADGEKAMAYGSSAVAYGSSAMADLTMGEEGRGDEGALRNRPRRRQDRLVVTPPKPRIRALDPLPQPDPVPPSKPMQPADVEQLAGHAVRFRGVEGEPHAGVHLLAEGLRQLADAQILPRADVDVLILLVVAHEEEAGVGEVVDVQQLAPGLARAPHRHLVLTRGAGLVEAAHQRRQHVGALEIEVVVRTIEIGRHGRDEVAAILPAVGLAELDARDLGDGVGLVGGLQQAGEQILLADRLRALPGVDAGASQVEQAADGVEVGGLHHRGVDHEIVVDELRRPGGVGENAAHRAGDQEDVLRPVGPEPVGHRSLIAQVELLAAGGEEVLEPLLAQPADDGRADQSTMAGDVDPCGARNVDRHF